VERCSTVTHGSRGEVLHELTTMPCTPAPRTTQHQVCTDSHSVSMWHTVPQPPHRAHSRGHGSVRARAPQLSIALHSPVTHRLSVKLFYTNFLHNKFTDKTTAFLQCPPGLHERPRDCNIIIQTEPWRVIIYSRLTVPFTLHYEEAWKADMRARSLQLC